MSSPASSSLKSPASLDAGGHVAGYRLITAIGSGGMGRVFLAHDDALDRKVALKVLPPEDADEEARARFLRESRALARVDHPHVVRVFASGDDDGVAWMALEYIEGDPLSWLLEEGPLDEETALSLAAQAARGLAAAHREGVVHRDVKPDNLLLDDEGVLRVVDFGIALVNEPMGTGGFTTQTGVAVGTPHYMAPEQARGASVDARADVWGLGATLFTLLSGRPPFFTAEDEGDLDILARVLREPVPALEERAPGVSAETARLVGRLLEKDRDARLANLDEVAASLDALADRAMRTGEGERSYPVLPERAPTGPATTQGAPSEGTASERTASWSTAPERTASEGAASEPARGFQLALLLVAGALFLAAGGVVGKLVSDRSAASTGMSEGLQGGAPHAGPPSSAVGVDLRRPTDEGARAPGESGARLALTRPSASSILEPTPLEPTRLEEPLPVVADPAAEVRALVEAVARGGKEGDAALAALVARDEPAATRALVELSRAPGPPGDRVLDRIASARAAAHLPAVEAALFGPVPARQRRAVAVLVEVRNMEALSLLLRASESHEVPAVRALATKARRELFSVEGE